MSNRGATALRGVLLVDKPTGMTSHDVVAQVRRATGEGRVGHAGTLDPAATGLLVVLIGPYTRLEPYLSRAEKRYEARIAFGWETDTDDAEGEVVHTAPTPDRCADADWAQGVLDRFLGPSLQTPPAYSAIKVGGKVAHRAARAGQPLELQPRPIEVLEATLLSATSDPCTWDVDFRVSKGTYVRSLARDVGRACESAAHLSALRRTASGPLSIKDAHRLDDVVSAAAEGHIGAMLADPLEALGLPVLDTPRGITDQGRPVTLAQGSTYMQEEFVAVTSEGRLAGVYRVQGICLVPAVVLPAEEVS